MDTRRNSDPCVGYNDFAIRALSQDSSLWRAFQPALFAGFFLCAGLTVARIRTIKPDFFTSEDIVSLSPLARLLYVALWCEADREGRMRWRPGTFEMRYFPKDGADMAAVCGELTERGLVRLYGEGLAWIPSFLTHQHVNPRESKSELPAPPDEPAPVPRARATQELRQKVFDRDGGKCKRCGSVDRLEVDHIFPKSAGGPAVLENLRLLCKRCNAGRPVNGQALIDDLKKDGFEFAELWARYSQETPKFDASNLELLAQVGREGKEGKGKEHASARVDCAEKDQPPPKATQSPTWWKTHAGIDEMGRQLGVPARRGEDYPEYKSRLFDALNSKKAATA